MSLQELFKKNGTHRPSLVRAVCWLAKQAGRDAASSCRRFILPTAAETTA